MLISSPGIFPNISPADYFADPCPRPSFTQSLAKVVLDQSALHARNEHPRLRPAELEEAADPYTAPKAIGNAAHRLLIGRGKDVEVIAFDNFKKAAAQELRDAAASQGRVPILEKHYQRALEMVGAARLQLEVAGWGGAFRDGRGEVCIAWQEGDVWFRSLIDWMESGRVLYDYKTGGGSFAPHAIGMKAEADGWDVQASMQERGLDVLDAKNAGRRTFRFVAQENYAPFALTCVELDEHWLVMGHKKLTMAVDIWTRAMSSGIWPSYPATPITPDYPGFRESKFLDREQTFHDNRERISPTRREPMLTDLSGG